MQFSLIEAFDAGFTDVMGAAVIHGIEGFKLFLVDPPHIAHRMRKMRALRVVAHQLRDHFNPGQAELVHGNPGDLFFGELKQNGHRLEGPTPLSHALFKQGTVFWRELQHFDDHIEHLLPVTGTFAGHAQAEAGPVVRDHHTVAVENQATRRGNGLHVHPVVFRQGRVVLVLHNLQVVQARNQRTNERHHHNCADHNAAAHKACVFLVVFEANWLRHSGR